MSSLSPDQVAQDSRGIDEPVLVPSTERRERLSAWLQFSRRIVLLLISFALALLLLRAPRGPLVAIRATAILDQNVDWSVSWLEQRPWAEIVWAQRCWWGC
jgi:hypothetical protein